MILVESSVQYTTFSPFRMSLCVQKSSMALRIVTKRVEQLLSLASASLHEVPSFDIID